MIESDKMQIVLVVHTVERIRSALNSSLKSDHLEAFMLGIVAVKARLETMARIRVRVSVKIRISIRIGVRVGIGVRVAASEFKL